MIQKISVFLIVANSCLGIISNVYGQEQHDMLRGEPLLKPENMKHLGLIGGTSWHSTVEYYEYINASVNAYYGDNTNPPLSVYTLNQAEVHRFQRENKWDSIAYVLSDAGKRLKNAGAEAVLFCANTPHKVYDQVEAHAGYSRNTYSRCHCTGH